MTDLQFVNSRIKSTERELLLAERYYHHAVQYGSWQEGKSALADCRRLRAKLDVLVKQRNNLTGGEPDEQTN